MAGVNATLELTYESLPAWAQGEVPFPDYYELLMSPIMPFGVAAVYLALVMALNPSAAKVRLSRAEITRKGGKSSGSSSGSLMTAVVVLHNLILCIYSAWSMIGAYTMLRDSFVERPFWDAVCDPYGERWVDRGLFKYSYIFYLSKYYELIDTAIILIKGRRCSFLQAYHHAGVIPVMWINTLMGSSPVWIFVLFNSTVHTVMYFYYMFTALGVYIPGKQYLTRLQITQFLVGTSLALSYIAVPKCLTPTQKIAVWGDVLYLLPLIYLFFDFARRTYGAHGNKALSVEALAQAKIKAQ
ncbi:ELO family [Piptocephalis cylindrospora]|uniref:Elongation of fatty acids protein n=1 Tax=Piptocephalis cylindrospora TaxID=1907219 RepID=A0A4P9Y1Y1_9FUNG|nr:ELO family [Piptocephalis cylindrospora]|eukprot:RKP12858.1 ELO family [Piptocephalis cylindrospora]